MSLTSPNKIRRKDCNVPLVIVLLQFMQALDSMKEGQRKGVYNIVDIHTDCKRTSAYNHTLPDSRCNDTPLYNTVISCFAV